MKRIASLTIAITAALSSLMACTAKAEKADSANDASKVLVAYFSATGTTKAVAEQIATATGGELMEIKPTEAYSDADLDWRVASSRCSRENADPKSRPTFVKSKDNLDQYDMVFLGFPNWWNGAPRIINTFVETYGLKGKRVVMFMTSGGSGIENSERAFKSEYPDVDWQPGRLLNYESDSTVASWAKKCIAK